MSKKKDVIEYEEGKITVAVRCRPFNEREHDAKSAACIGFAPDGQTLTIYDKAAPGPDVPPAEAAARGGHSFTFDHSYNMRISQQQVYEDVGRPVLHASFFGFNTCIFAYGQTGSGKSYAMMGPTGPTAKPEAKGIIPRLCGELFSEVISRMKDAAAKYAEAANDGIQECDRPPKVSFVVEVSYLEIYQENVRCLLNSKKDKLKVRQHPTTGVYVENLTEVPVTSFDKVAEMIESGNSVRHVASTNMNDQSSRSHAIFSIILTQKRVSMTKDGTEMVADIKAKINLVDLAGSERAKSTGAEGGTLKEGAQINKSLSTLGLVISGLADMAKKGPGGKAPFIPYRDSMLTWLLKESLGGNSKTFMLSTLSPALINYDETLSTLRYADRAKAIVTRACVNENPGDKKVRELEEEIGRLRDFIKNMASAPTPASQPRRASNAGAPTTPPAVPASPGTTSPSAELSGASGAGGYDDLGATSRLSYADLEERLTQAQALIDKERLTDDERREQQARDMDEVEAQIKQSRTIKAPKQDPYLLNVDGIGDWVAETLVDEVTYLGTEELDEPVVGARCVILHGEPEDLAGVGPQHCCFLRDLITNTITLRPLFGYQTFLENDDDPLDRDVVVVNGQVIQLGESYISFKLVEPSAPPQTARNRRNLAMTARRNTMVEPEAQAATTPVAEKAAPPPPPPPTMPPLAIPSKHVDPTPPPHPPTDAAERRMSVGPSTAPASKHLDLVQGGPTASHAAAAAPEDVLHMYRYTFLFLGQRNSGKSATRVSLSKEDKWFPFFRKEVPQTKPTFAVESSSILASGITTKADLTLLELGGNASFSLLQQLLPERRVTYVLCFRLTDDHSNLAYFRNQLEFILCQSTAESNVILLGTCADIARLETSAVVSLMGSVANEVTTFFKLRQPRAEACPRVVAKFAVSNKDRTVVPVGAIGSHVNKISDLLTWLADHAIHRCKSDADFPNAAVPSRVLAVARRIAEWRQQGIWCVPASEYKKLAREVDSRYEKGTDVLHQHTQLLHAWGVLHHHFRHLHLKRTIVLDVPWVMRLIAALCCCIPAPAHRRAAEAALAGPEPPSGDSLLRLGLLSPEVVQYGDGLPFLLSDVRQTDRSGRSTTGVLPVALLQALFKKLIKEKNYVDGDIEPALELLESYDLLLRASRVKPSVNHTAPDNRSLTESFVVETLAAEAAAGEDDENEEAEEIPETFFLMPSCFVRQPPMALTVHLPKLLFGPSYKFQLNMVPTHFFARFVSRVSRYADYLYLGPLHVEHSPPPANSAHVHGAIREVHGADLWSSCLWIISATESRAFVRMVHNSLYITFHDYAADEVFHEGLRDVVHCLVAESPGAQCQELILCRHDIDSEEEIWVEKTENLNSLEKILEREQAALRTARGQAPPMDQRDLGDGPVPLVRSADGDIDVIGITADLTTDTMFSNQTLKYIEAALHLIHRGRNCDDRDHGVAIEAKGFDHLVDALASS